MVDEKSLDVLKSPRGQELLGGLEGVVDRRLQPVNADEEAGVDRGVQILHISNGFGHDLDKMVSEILAKT